ncbi:glycosyltransferase family 39 protein [Rhodoferax sp.]|uniref:ArnT family glycosyltransferase n=1 Tax=Rhodoferax sp. TaxID=50421 RepID=UPI0019DA36C0|nr:glycosyltransferase family 39 protein [Rhodoferax sp.]MBE0473026.1 hypothetical protein [Rhodoferax sp.]
MELLKRTTSYPALFSWAILCFVPTLFYFYVGEEGVFTLNSMEMWNRQEFMSTVMYGAIGGGGGRPPLMNWIMIPIANLIGWEHVLVASRLVSVGATIGTSLTVAWLAHSLWRNDSVTRLAAILYLVTADVMLYRGWLSYADPLFAMFVVLAIAQTWVACLRKNHWLLFAAMLSAFAAFMTKALTVYMFLGIAIMVLIRDVENRRILLGKMAWLAYACAMLLPFIWWMMGTHDSAQHAKMSDDILSKLVIPNIGNYLLRLVAYPSEMFLRLMPASLIIAYFLLRQRVVALQQPAVGAALLIALMNYLPYLIAPEGGVRYVLPVYSFVVLAAAYLVVHETSPFQVKKWLVGMLLLGSTVHTVVFPWYQRTYRGENYAQMAKEIVQKYGDYPLYVTNVASVGLAVAAEINTLRFEKHAPLLWPPADFKEGIVIAHAPEDVKGEVLRKLQVNGDSVFLLCRGNACKAENH